MTNIVNTRLLWSGINAAIAAWNSSFSFNWFNLNNGDTIRLTACDYDDIGTIDFETFNYWMQDWGWVLWKYYRTKQIHMTLSIKSDSVEWLNALIDEIKYQTSVTEWGLRIIVWWVVRERQATCTALKFNRQAYNVDWLGQVQLTFNCTNPHSHLVNLTNIDITAQTWTTTWTAAYEWRANAYPILTFTIETWWTSQIKLQLNEYMIYLASDTYSVWDIICFDWNTKKVTVNDVEKQYYWAFTPFKYWDNPYMIYYIGKYTWTLSYYTKFL